MSNWKKRIEEKRNEDFKKAREEELQRKAGIEARKEAERLRDEMKWKAERAKRLSKLQARFKCYICGKPSSEPGKREESTDRLVQHHEFYSGPQEYETITIDDWNIPGDLIKCDNCKKWTCIGHSHWGVCKNCAERL